MQGVVGHIDYRDCEECIHYRPDKGGCEPLDKCCEGDIFTMDFITETVVCTEFKEKKET